MANLEFVTAAFGPRYLPQLPPLIYSINQSHPGSKILLLWEDLPSEFIGLLQRSFPQLTAVETQLAYTSDLARRISSKTLAWSQAGQTSHARHLFFLDTDMLVLKNLDWLCDQPADLVISETGSFFPINSGVLYCHNSKATRKFFQSWTEKTLSILNTPELYSRVNDKHQPYGGADQMALMQLINYRATKKKFSYKSGRATLRITALPCRLINEVRSAPVTDQTHVIHYKGGWRSILFYGEDFTLNRPRKASWEMYLTYLKTYLNAVSYINTSTDSRFSPRHFGLYLPFYLNTHTWQADLRLYRLFQLTAKVRHYFRSAGNLLRFRDLNY